MDEQRDWQNEVEAAKKEIITVIREYQPISPDDLEGKLSTNQGPMAIAYYRLYQSGYIIETDEGIQLTDKGKD